VRAELLKTTLLCGRCHQDLHAGRIVPDPAALVPIEVPDLTAEPPRLERP
jgi:hypothetical protein